MHDAQRKPHNNQEKEPGVEEHRLRVRGSKVLFSAAAFNPIEGFVDTMESSAKVTLFEDIFEIAALNPDGYKFERVNRIQATGTTFECELLLDVNCEIYTLHEMDKFTLVLASTLHLDGSPADHFSYVPANHAEPSLADNYEYVMHGRVFDMSYKKDGTVIIAISYGGLLMRLTGDQRHLTSILPDQRLYLLLKKD